MPTTKDCEANRSRLIGSRELPTTFPIVRLLKVEAKTGKLPRAQVELDCGGLLSNASRSGYIAEEDLEQTTGRRNLSRSLGLAKITGGKGIPQTVVTRPS